MRGFWIIGFLALGVAQLPAQTPAYPQAAPPAQNPAGAREKAGKAPAAEAPGIIDPESVAARLMLATPEQRERALARLPADRQEQIRRQLEHFDSLPKEQQEVEIRRLQHFGCLPPDQQVIVRLQAQALAKLPQGRRQAVRRALANLQTLPLAQRAVRMNNPAFRSRFSPEELKIIEDLADGWLLPRALPPPAPAPR